MCVIHAGWPSWSWVKQFRPFQWWIRHAFQSTFGKAVDWQCIILMWYQSWFTTVSISPQQNFHILLVPDCCWCTTSNFCAGYSCTLPCLWDIPHTLISLSRDAIPPHTPCFPICSECWSCPWRWQHTQGPCLPSSNTLPCCIVIIFLMALHFLPLIKVLPSCGPT